MQWLKNLWENRSTFPIDKIGHCIVVGFLPTFGFSFIFIWLGILMGCWTSLLIELVQAESQENIFLYLKLNWKDILGDLIADGIGIALALIVRSL